MFSLYHRNYNKLYTKLVELSRNTFFYNDLSFKDTLETRIYLVFFHLSIIILIINNKFKNKKENQFIFDNIFQNIEYHLRENGMGDVSVNKRMKDLTKIFYDILIKLNLSKDNNFTVNEKLTFKYIQIISNKNNNNEKFKDYLISFYKFCFDLELKDIISGDIKFK